MPCQATHRTRTRTHGWVCTGEDLVSVLHFTTGGETIDMVIPREALEIVMSREFAMGYDVRDFAGGDHFHLCLTPAEAADLEFASHR